MPDDKGITASGGNTPVSDVPPDYYHPGHGHWYILPEGRDAGKKMFFRDESFGSDKPAATIVFVHGNPESSYTYRKIIRSLEYATRSAFRVVAMDHIGFGLSDRASYEMVSMDHAENLLQLVRRLDLNHVTLVIHDWGGPIGIGAFLREPERVDNLVLLNSTVFPMPQDGLTYSNYPIPWLGWCQSPYVIPDRFWGEFASYAIFRTPAPPRKILSRMATYIAKARAGLFPRAERVARKLYRDQFQSRANTKSSKRLVLQSGLWGYGNRYDEPVLGTRDTAPFYRYIQDNIKRLWGPEGRNIGTRAVLGKWDPLGKDSVIEQWTQNLPQMKGNVRVLENVGHFIEEERPSEIVSAIVDVAGIG